MTDEVALLSRTPAALDALLRGLPDSWTRRNEGAESWTPFDVVGHLIHCEQTDWIPRARIILEHGESRPFDPFDRTGYDGRGKSLDDVLDEFARARAASLEQLRAFNLQPADLARRGAHPSLGGVTLGQLLATWAGHDLTHLHQISRVMAYQIRDAVGSWTAYLGVMHCDAHSG